MTLRDQMGKRVARSANAAPGTDEQNPRLVIDVDSAETATLLPAQSEASPGRSADPRLIAAPGPPVIGIGDDDPQAGSWSGALVRAGVRPLLISLDVTACVAGSLASGGIRPVMALFTALLLVLYGTGGLHRSRLSPSLLDDLPQLTGRLLVVLALTMSCQLTLNQLRWDTDLVDWNLLVAAAVTGFTTIWLRAGAYALVRHARRTGRIVHRTLILGAGRVGTYLAESLSTHPQYGLQPIGFLDVDPPRPSLKTSHRVLGRPEQLVEVLLDHQVRNVIVAFGSMRESQMVDIIRTCDRLRCEIFVVPRLFELHHVADDMDTVWGLPLIRLRRAAYRSPAWRIKRVLRRRRSPAWRCSCCRR